MQKLSRCTRFSLGKIWFEGFAPCKIFDISQLCVMRESGVCTRHCPDSSVRRPGAPHELVCVTKKILPEMILRLLQHLREASPLLLSPQSSCVKVTIEQADRFLNLLHEFCDLGTAMRSIIQN